MFLVNDRWEFLSEMLSPVHTVDFVTSPVWLSPVHTVDFVTSPVCQRQSNMADFVDFQQSRPCWIQLCR